jgi:hypothetical protein
VQPVDAGAHRCRQREGEKERRTTLSFQSASAATTIPNDKRDYRRATAA